MNYRELSISLSLPNPKKLKKLASKKMMFSSSTVDLEYKAPIYLATLKTKENRFSIDLINDLNTALDLVVAKRVFGQPQALVVTNSNGKIFSNGLLLNLLVDVGPVYFKQYQHLLAKLLIFPIPSIAAINGHAFAGGCMFAMVLFIP
jgi:enoyl-CoA hydratase/carnithine racemase